MGVESDRPPGAVRAVDVDLDGEQLVVVSYPVPSSDEISALTEAEREVARLVVEGCSNKAIAVARGTAERTVANQIASIFRKLRVGSRVELAAALALSHTREDPR